MNTQIQIPKSDFNEIELSFGVITTYNNINKLNVPAYLDYLTIDEVDELIEGLCYARLLMVNGPSSIYSEETEETEESENKDYEDRVIELGDAICNFWPLTGGRLKRRGKLYEFAKCILVGDDTAAAAILAPVIAATYPVSSARKDVRRLVGKPNIRLLLGDKT